MNYRYRYRCRTGTTRGARSRFHLLANIGTVYRIAGVLYKTRIKGSEPYTVERVRIEGSGGQASFDGLCWGYGGEGPRGLRDMLLFLGFSKPLAELVAFKSPRNNDQALGTDWSLETRLPQGVVVNNANGQFVFANGEAFTRPSPVSLLQ